ncbi:hypothetical protein Bca52824_092863 [Brassica carinata]|uniref:Transmembrane protein n=1 Tax=Brassica carinata TaxID=52824 RepID=A0A8X7P731_BRACI|nr:hypothetical protein Bca52824_092863 [Brassica carinata]
MAGENDWRKTADTTKMSPEGVKAAGLNHPRGPRSNPGGVLHQRRNLPYSYTTMAIAGLAISGAVMYTVMYAKKKPEASATDVAKAATGTAKPEDTHPRK